MSAGWGDIDAGKGFGPPSQYESVWTEPAPKLTRVHDLDELMGPAEHEKGWGVTPNFFCLGTGQGTRRARQVDVQGGGSK